MGFSIEEKALFERQYNGIRARIECLRRRPKELSYAIEEHPYLWERVNRLSVMPREELMNEIMADYVLFGCSFEE